MYVIVHPAFPGHVKVGTTTGLKGRLATYNTSCPYGQFEVALVVTVPNRREVERALCKMLAPFRCRDNAEWFRVSADHAAHLLTNISTRATVAQERT